MKKNKKTVVVIIMLLCMAVFLCSCGGGSSIMKNASSDVAPAIKKVSGSPIARADGFAANIAVVPADASNSPESDKLHSEAALLVDVNEGKVLFQKNAHHKEYPASTTKVLTSLIALKYGDKTASRKIGDEVIIREDNVVMCDYRVGDEVSFDVMIHGAMMRSGNDAAAALALFTADSLSDFADLMNREALELGATESHFANPHGLYDDNHYTTAYDLYLIFNEAIKYPDFISVLSCLKYDGSFNRMTAYGNYIINVSYNNTNQYLTGQRSTPDYIKIVGGKAGYTKLARRSYVMLAEANGHKYILVTMRCDDVNWMYDDLDFLLSMIPDEDTGTQQTEDESKAEASENETMQYRDDD